MLYVEAQGWVKWLSVRGGWGMGKGIAGESDPARYVELAKSWKFCSQEGRKILLYSCVTR